MNHPQTAEEWLETIYREFEKESDRAAAIVAGAMLDEVLRHLIDKRLVPTSKERSLVDRYDAPLGSFAARIDAAFQLGLISKYMAADLHLIRKIRNDFAHAVLELTFEAKPIKDRIVALDKTANFIERNRETRSTMGPAGPRGDFLCIASWMLYALHCDDVHRLREHEPEFGYVDYSSLPSEIQELLRQAAN